MDFTDDPLLAGRNFSYQDTQISRLGINFGDIPVNRPVCPFMTNQQDGQGAMWGKKNRTRYHPNRFDALPLTSPKKGGFKSYPEVVAGIQDRVHGPKFNEFTDQATLFYNSMSEEEKEHIASAAHFELTKCADSIVHQNTINRWNLIDHDFAVKVAAAFPHVTVPDAVKPNHGRKSAFLSQIEGKTQTFTSAGRKVAIYVLPGFEYTNIAQISAAFQAASIIVKYVGPATGDIKSAGGETVLAEFTFENSRSTYFDAVIFAGGAEESYAKQLKMGRLVHAAREAFMHKKAIGATGNAIPWLTTMCLPGDVSYKNGVTLDNGVIMAEDIGAGAEFATKFLDTLSKHRVWAREVSHIAA